MRRILLTAAAMTIVAAGQMGSAHADEEVIDADVGGGAALVQVEGEAQSYVLRDLDLKDRIRYNNAAPYVVMGKNGGNAQRQLVRQGGSLARVEAGVVTIKGNRQGTPYAEASATLTGITLQRTPIKALKAWCRWDKDHEEGYGYTQVTDNNGDTYEPAPNTEIPIPGLGTLYLNEQFITRQYVGYVNGAFLYRKVIYVHAARLHVSTDQELPAGLDAYGGLDVILGLASCDPVKLPNLSGLKLSETAA